MFIRATMPNMKYAGLGRLRGLRGRRKPLGCPQCTGKPLGQDDGDILDTGDIFSAGYDPLSSIPVSAPLPVGAGTITTMDSGGNLITSNPNPYDLPGLTNGAVYPSGMTPAQSLALAQSGSTSGIAAGISAAGAALKSALAPTSGPFILGTSASGSSSAAALNSYMPLIILGLGGIALIAVLKKR